MSDKGDGKPYRQNNVHEFPQRKLQPFRTISPSIWDEREPAPIRWLVQGCIPRRAVVIFSGDSGLGKSLLMQQLQTSCATGLAWLGHKVERVRSLGFYCEDPELILQHRQRHIVRHLNRREADLDDMLLADRTGMDNILMDFNRRTDASRTTALFQQLKTEVLDFGAELTIIDTAAQTFGGNENFRYQATAFVNQLQEIANLTDGVVVLCTHPSGTGLLSGSGSSGSTGWRAVARSFMYLKRPKDYNDEDPEADHDIRILQTKKNNWGKASGMIKLRWNEGVFEVVNEPQKIAAISESSRNKLYADITKAVRYFMMNDQKMAVNPQAPRNYIVRLLMMLPTTKDYERSALASAVEKMAGDGRLVKVELGSPSGRAMYYRTPDTKYPGEK